MPLSRYSSAITEDGLRNNPESQYFERKGRDTKPTKIADELIGLLNAGGGVLVYGIADDGHIEDLQEGSLLKDTAPELDRYRTLLHEFIKPPANIEVEDVYLENGELVLLYHVEPDYERLFQREDNEAVFLRIGDRNFGPLDREQVKKLEYNKNVRAYEDELREDFHTDDFDSAMCETYRKSMRYTGSFDDLAVKRRLAARKGGTVLFKNAAILLFCNDPSQYIPNAYVRYVRYNGTELKPGSQFNVIKDESFEGNIPNLIERLEAFVSATLRDYYYLNMENGRFESVPEYPKDAWLEGIVNALCHRSYNLQGNAIYIKHFDDRLEISNSGPLPAQVTTENIQEQRYARNPQLARVLADMKYVRELNEGVPRIFNAMRESMLAKPVYKDQNGTVTLTLRNKVTEHKETIYSETLECIETRWAEFNKSQRQIIELLFEYQEMNVAAFEQRMPLSGQAIRLNLKFLIELKVVERLSNKTRDPNALYRFLNK
jgi:ATP-dependent DNA helicase RecG